VSLGDGYAEKVEQPVVRPGGTEMVDVSRIEEPADIHGPEDFRASSDYVSLKRELQMHEQMRPAIEQGADLNTFDAWDQRHRLGHYS
jgi:hypothetical protein